MKNDKFSAAANLNIEFDTGDLTLTNIVVTDDQVDSAVGAIVKSAKTGKIGDGKVFVSPIENAVRIRTEETGENAV